jgi:cytoskeleton protein RodZ
MTKQQNDNESQPENSLGDLLLRTRQARQKTLAEAADATRINAKFLQALEENDFDKLPDEIFTRGFIKLYATYLGLDPNDTFKHYIAQENLDPCKPDVKLQPDELIDRELLDRTSAFIKKSRKILPITILLSILVLFYILGVFFKSEEQSSYKLTPEADITLSQVDPSTQADSGQTTSPQKGQIPQKIAEPPSKQAEKKVKPEGAAADRPTPPAVEKPTPPTPKTSVIQPVKRIEQTKSLTLPVTVKVATASPPPKQLGGPADVDFKYVLEARFEESSLVRIKVDDKPQLQYNSQAGIVRIWKAKESIALDLDNRAGVSLTLNGRPFAITDTGGPTAIINIPADIPTSNNP